MKYEEYTERDEKGNLIVPPCSGESFIRWPVSLKEIFKGIFGYPGYILPHLAGYILLAFITFYFLQPDLSRMKTLQFGWVGVILLRNEALLWVFYGIPHLLFFKLKILGTDRKHTLKWQGVDNKKFMFNNQVYDNVFRTCVQSGLIWTGYEVLYFWMAANGRVPLLQWTEHPAGFIAWFLLIPIWRVTHFYWIHRLIHWRPLFRTVHKIHHMNPDPAPWSGMAMHPVEGLLYLSCCLIHFVIPSHPVHFLLNTQHTALTPALGHLGFKGPFCKGKFPSDDYFHYLHHRYVNCNFGGPLVPFDKWLGTFHDGTGLVRKQKESS